MSYDPTKPANNSPLSSAEMRTQLTGLKAQIDTKATPADINNAIAGTANNPNGQVGNLDPNWTPSGDTNADLQWLHDRLIEFYNATIR